jgi:hypothetical protein
MRIERCDMDGCIRLLGHDGVHRQPRAVMDIILGPGSCGSCGARVWWAFKGVRGDAAWRTRTGERHWCPARRAA